MAKKIDREVLAGRIRELEGLSLEERSALLELLNTKKYGLVWENHVEDVEEHLREYLPVLKEDTSKALTNGGEDAPNHILIEGDNLDALTALTYTHEGKIDVIYIDPPYNLGKDFMYNDKCVDENDSYRHSKWLSAMSKRLMIARKILSNEGVIFISINYVECSQLKLLCDEIWGENNFIGHLTWESVTQPVNTGSAKYRLQQKVESILCYAKCKSEKPDFILKEVESMCKYPHVGKFGKCRFEVLEKSDAGSYNRETMKYQILGQYPRSGKRWQIGEDTARELEQKGKVEIIEGVVKKAVYPEDEIEKRKFDPFWSHFSAKDVGSALNGKDELNEVLGGNVGFDTVKPTKLIMELLSHFPNNITVMDYYCGSGTTLHSVMKCNSIDNGRRRCITIQSPDSICESENIPQKGFEYLFSLGCRNIADLAYRRLFNVINGYTTPKGEHVEGLHNNNLRYYKVDFVERDNTMEGMRKLMGASTDLICIKHDVYNEEHTFGSLKLRPHIARYFEESEQKVLIIYKVDAIAHFVREIAKMPEGTNVMVYVFSTNNYAMGADFEDVADKVTLCAMPAAIYNAYLKVLPKKKIPVEADKEQEEPTLFDGEEDKL